MSAFNTAGPNVRPGPVPSLPADVLAELQGVLSGFPCIGLAVLFGSVASGRAQADSDLDLAVQAPRSLTVPEHIALTRALADKTGRPIDLIDLSMVGGPLLGQIVHHGVRVQGTNTQFGQLINKYLVEQADFMPYRNRVLQERRKAWIGM